ncbi:putative phage abortive infection protein [Bacillus subtilis subsp. subtilis]
MKGTKKSELFAKESWVMYAGIIVCIVAIITPFLVLHYLNDTYLMSFKDIGAFGDFFGGTTVGLFNFSSILLVLAAVIIQRKELKDTRNQFQKQQIDNTFFNMINLHNQIVSELVIEEYQGRAALNQLNKRIKSGYKFVQLEDKKERLTITYEDLYKEYYFGHYFRNMYRIMKFIDQAKELSEDEKKELHWNFKGSAINRRIVTNFL